MKFDVVNCSRERKRADGSTYTITTYEYRTGLFSKKAFDLFKLMFNKMMPLNAENHLQHKSEWWAYSQHFKNQLTPFKIESSLSSTFNVISDSDADYSFTGLNYNLNGEITFISRDLSKNCNLSTELFQYFVDDYIEHTNKELMTSPPTNAYETWKTLSDVIRLHRLLFNNRELKQDEDYSDLIGHPLNAFQLGLIEDNDDNRYKIKNWIELQDKSIYAEQMKKRFSSYEEGIKEVNRLYDDNLHIAYD